MIIFLQRCRQCNRNQVINLDVDCEEIGSDGNGVDNTFSLYISATTSGSCPVSVGSRGSLAFAGTCVLEDDFDRSVNNHSE